MNPIDLIKLARIQSVERMDLANWCPSMEYTIACLCRDAFRFQRETR